VGHTHNQELLSATGTFLAPVSIDLDLSRYGQLVALDLLSSGLSKPEGTLRPWSAGSIWRPFFRLQPQALEHLSTLTGLQKLRVGFHDNSKACGDDPSALDITTLALV
jgi:hypothetical protein